MKLVITSIFFFQFPLLSHSATSVSDSALNNFIKELYTADVDRATSAQLRVDFQAYADNKNLVDQANRKLFKHVGRDLLAKPVYRKFMALLDNYYYNTGRREDENGAERTEIDEFLDEILNTKVFNKTYDFLRSQSKELFRKWTQPSDVPTFSGWTQPSQDPQFLKTCPSVHSRRFIDTFKVLSEGDKPSTTALRGVADTSAFEHVFVGEVSEKNNEIGGMHNWVRFYTGENDGSVDYAGYVVKRKNVALVMFRWKNLWKTTGSFMIGTSPAFDVAVYSLCFWLKPGFRACRFNLDGCDVEITSHPAQQNGKTFIGTAFPSPGRPSSTCR